jgi:hypothetical protein
VNSQLGGIGLGTEGRHGGVDSTGGGAILRYDAHVKRTTVFFPEELHEQLRRDAFRTKVSMAALIQKRLQAAVGRPRVRGSLVDPILKVAGICRGPVLSDDIDDSLYRG